MCMQEILTQSAAPLPPMIVDALPFDPALATTRARGLLLIDPPLSSSSGLLVMSMIPPTELNTLHYRMENLEHQVKNIQEQLRLYVTQRENELQLRTIQQSVERTEQEAARIRQQITDLATRIEQQEKEARARDEEQRQSQDKLQIRVLYGIVSVVITILVGVLIAYLTHLIH